MTRWLESDSLSNQNIAAALAIGAYTADADRLVLVQVFADAVAGDGTYTLYLTQQVAGAGSHYRHIPITEAAAASGVTAIAAQSILVAVRSGDVLTVYLDGLDGDTTTPDTLVRWFELAALRPTTADRTLDVAATGEAGIDLTNKLDTTGILPVAAAGAASGLALVGSAMTISGTLATLDALWAKVQKWLRLALRKDAAVATDHATELAEINADGGTGAGAYASTTDAQEAIRDNMGTAQTGDAYLRLTGTVEPLVAAQAIRNAMKLAPAAGDPAAGSVDKHLDDLILYETGSGPGASDEVYTVTVGGLPLAGVYCRMTTDAAGLVNVDAGTTNAAGQVTFHHDLATGTTVYVWRTLAGYAFTDPDTEVIP